jgi:very-short-patch-repair endonuclease
VSIGTQRVHKSAGSVWSLAEKQHGVVSRRQLLNLGWHPAAIKHRIAKGRLHSVRRGVYAVGRPELTVYGHWMATVLLCGPEAFLSHRSAAAIWGIRRSPRGSGRPDWIDVTVPAHRRPGGTGIRVHRVRHLPDADRSQREGIPVTSPVRTLIDLAVQLNPSEVEAAVNQADKLDLVNPEALRREIGKRPGHRGVAVMRGLLDGRTFSLTDSELERRFLRLVHRAGLPTPLTQQRLNGFRVDFYWPELGIVIETDGLRYHRTPTQQGKDRVRDQAHTAAGLITIRFTHAQVRFDAGRVAATLRSVAERQRLLLLGAR